MLIDIDWVLSVRKKLGEMNTCDIEEITWIKDGEEVLFSDDDIEDWTFSGLNNTDILYIRPYTTKTKET